MQKRVAPWQLALPVVAIVPILCLAFSLAKEAKAAGAVIQVERIVGPMAFDPLFDKEGLLCHVGDRLAVRTVFGSGTITASNSRLRVVDRKIGLWEAEKQGTVRLKLPGAADVVVKITPATFRVVIAPQKKGVVVKALTLGKRPVKASIIMEIFGGREAYALATVKSSEGEALAACKLPAGVSDARNIESLTLRPGKYQAIVFPLR